MKQLPPTILLDRYLTARKKVVDSGYGTEIDWQFRVSLETLDETELLREAAWVILSAGMKEQIVRSVFPAISDAFLGWVSASAIAARVERCVRDASKAFAHFPKLRAIGSVATQVGCYGFNETRESIRSRGVTFLSQWPYVGPVTCFHLAKNIGLDVAKPDRHLVRLAKASGHRDVDELCLAISQLTGERVSVIDYVLWRYATLEPLYCDHFLAETVAVPSSRPTRRHRRSGREAKAVHSASL